MILDNVYDTLAKRRTLNKKKKNIEKAIIRMPNRCTHTHTFTRLYIYINRFLFNYENIRYIVCAIYIYIICTRDVNDFHFCAYNELQTYRTRVYNINTLPYWRDIFYLFRRPNIKYIYNRLKRLKRPSYDCNHVSY